MLNIHHESNTMLLRGNFQPISSILDEFSQPTTEIHARGQTPEVEIPCSDKGEAELVLHEARQRR